MFDKEAYDLSEITPETMESLDHFLERQAINNRIFNGKNLVNSYTCEVCGHVHRTVDVHVGTTPYLSDCPQPECPGTSVSGGYKARTHVDDYKGSIDFEWYRPLTEEECESARSLIETEARSLADNPIFPEEASRREFYVQAALQEKAKRVLTGVLMRRPREE